MRITCAAVGVIALTTGCTSTPSKTETETPVSRLDLRVAMGQAPDINPVGVSITPNGERFVFDSTFGLYRIDGETAVAIVPMAQLPTPQIPVQPPFTDMVAIAPGVFALTAIGDGFLLDTSAMTLTQHFCYLPDETPAGLTQRTDAIAYDPQLDRLYAQPRTFDIGGTFQYAQLAGYERATGTDIEWYNAADTVAATAMTVIPNLGLTLGQGSTLARFDFATSGTTQIADLARFGVRSIDGLAVDSTAQTLLVVDGTTDQLVEIDLASLDQ